MKSTVSILSGLEHNITQGRIPHASLFVGKMGYGTLSLALNFAKALLCRNPQNGAACNECNACLKSSKLIHPDLHFAFPVIKKDNKKREDTTSKDFLKEWRALNLESSFFDEQEWAEKIQATNKRLNINTTECNEIIQKMGLKSFKGGRKVLIIYLAEYLAKEGNRLLKIIEEPPPETYIMLIAENQENLLNTIVSRCQIIRTFPMQDAEIKAHLNQDDLDDSRQEEICFIANGDLIIAKKMARNEDNIDLSDQFLKWLRYAYLLNKKPKELIHWIAEFSKLGKTSQNSFLDYVLHFLREYQLFLLTGTNKVRLSQQELTKLENMKKIIDSQKVDELSQICDTLYYNLSRNVNSKIELMNASIEINNLLHKKLVLS